MRILLFWLTVFGSAAHALDYTNHEEVCVAMASASDETPSADELDMCACGFDILAAELGQDVVEISVRWQVEDKTLPELTDAFTVEEYYSMMAAVGPKIEDLCGS